MQYSGGLSRSPLWTGTAPTRPLTTSGQKLPWIWKLRRPKGFDAAKVDPNIVQKSSKDTEVQEGWLGHVIPFELVQLTLLRTRHDAPEAEEEDLAEIQSTYDEILDSLAEGTRKAALSTRPRS